jgi:orotidine-5'-phosphate decarboxylase
MEPKQRLIVALDVDKYEKAEKLVDILADEVDIFKVGIATFVDFGEKIIKKIQDKGKKTFLDLKFHDIPNTVRQVAKAAAKKKVFMMNFHCMGGKKMLEEAVKGAREAQEGKVLLLGVTVLTSMREEDLMQLGIKGSVENKVLELARLAKEAGLDGVVASSEEARRIKEEIGSDFTVVAPGIRPIWAASGDQKRVMTPEQAVRNGADYIVVGRPIVEADDPRDAARKIIDEIT